MNTPSPLAGLNTRLWSAVGLVSVLAIGTVIAFLPFYFGGTRMKDFCVALQPGTPSHAVRALANENGYEVSYEALYTPTRLDGGCEVDAGVDDGGAPCADAGVADDAGFTPQPFAGDALVTDPQFYRPICALHFDGTGHLGSSTFHNE
jgi:hypothetical protein